MIVPGLTRASRAHALDTLKCITGLSEHQIVPVFIDADKARVAILDPSVEIRRAAYRAQAYGARGADVRDVTGRGVALDIAGNHKLPVDVAAIILGAAIGLRLGLEVRRTRSTRTRPKLAAKVATFSKEPRRETDLQACRRWAREMGRVARGSLR